MAQKMNDPTSILTGFAAFDEMTSGFQSGDLVIIAGRRGMGKTAFALSMARNVTANNGYGVAYFSVEMSERHIVRKMITAEPANAKEAKLIEASLIVDDTPALSVAEFYGKCLLFKQKNDIRVAIIDNLQLMMEVDKNGQRIQSLLCALKEIAFELNITIVVLSQIDRSVFLRRDRRPEISCLPNKSIAEYADIILFIHRPEYYGIWRDFEGKSLIGVAEIIVAKNRNGIIGDVRLSFKRQFYKFVEEPGITVLKTEPDYDTTTFRNMDVKNLSVAQLESIILHLFYTQERTKEVEKKLNDALYERKRKIDQTFEWSPENIKRLLLLNLQLIDCWDKVDVKAKRTFNTLKGLLSDSGEFLHDFNIEAVVTSLVHIPDENGDYDDAQNCIEEVLIDSLDENYCVNRHSYDARDEEELLNDVPLYLNRKQNWSDDPIFEGNFDGHFISQAVHDLYDHTCLSMPDILKINRIRGELRIINQLIVEV